MIRWLLAECGLARENVLRLDSEDAFGFDMHALVYFTCSEWPILRYG